MKKITEKDKLEMLYALYGIKEQAQRLERIILESGGYYCPESGYICEIDNLKMFTEKLGKIWGQK